MTNTPKDETIGINRLILIGNGFDLAHGLKTGYNDFIIWYLNKALGYAQKNHQYDDQLLTVTVKDVNTIDMLRGPKLSTVPSFIDHYYEHGFEEMIKQRFLKIGTWSQNFINPFEINVKSHLLYSLLIDCKMANWVDIENTFYDHLKSALALTEPSNKSKLVTALNKSLSAIVTELESYLTTIETDNTVQGYADIINNPFDPSDFVDEDMHTENLFSIDSTHVLNFNYTGTAEKYIKNKKEQKIHLNYIHGKLGDEKNRIIFGFGDELDQEYANFELDRTRGIFDYIKSFWYFRTSNYHDLIRFIDSKTYQVYILGHSCGLSDRTMLNMVFEHENCKSVRIFYYQAKDFNNYTTITQEISRHFKNKQQMRKKIVPFDRSTPMPQALSLP
ncbi:hypothetical protein SRABI27_03744 [Pedobacter sp. Bi27]|uniref:AbiH family protein n=1 Tax=Pedobacter sp. Bi27 TaxID=2822351 RepID=UPI001DB2387C|nr:AbiH family protein [Pedobacter sp. Bi27]CAH0279917.1 hypothetical protein SRABI27_03744 [Pedobacter sp. Bi27]